MIPGSINALLLGEEAAAGGYTISRSLRFNSADSAYLSRTPASAGNRKTWTWAGWVKRSGLGSRQNVFGTADASFYNGLWLEFFSDDTVRLGDIGASALDLELRTSQVFRDPSSWGHLVIAIDTTQSTASNRIKFYWNGIQITAFSTSTYPTQNFDTRLNTASAHGIGRAGSYNAQYFNGYLADIHFIDGQALDPTSFGEFSATTGVWMPKAYTGSYGTNGFKLNFSDNSTTAALGTDTSGNGNTWSVNNLSVTAGAGNDSLVDVPVNGAQTDTGVGGEVRGNYCTANPLKTNSGVGFANGNLDLNATAAGWFSCYSTIGITSGKWYWEAEMTTNTSAALNALALGICPDDTNILSSYVGSTSDSYGVVSNGNKWNSASQTAYGTSFSAGDIAMVAFDDDNGKIWFGKNGTWFASGNPAAGTNAAYTSISATKTWIPVFSFDRGRFYCNFGQRPFAYTAPSGFKALCTANLPAPTIVKPSTVMDVVTYTGNGSSRSITNVGFSPDLIWTKQRSGSATAHSLHDIVRGTNKHLASSATDAEVDVGQYGGGITAFNSDGYSLGTWGAVNENNQTYVAWTWDAGSSTVTNTAGSITSSCRTNASSGFSIVAFTAQSSGSATIGHGLGVEPHLVIVKSRAQTYSWLVYHKNLTSNAYYLILNSTAAQDNTSNAWNSTTPTSTVFTLGSTYAGAGDTVAYCFAPVAGYSAFGSYTGNGSTDGPFVYTGFRPRWILLKDSTNAGSWELIDTARIGYNGANYRLFPNLSDAEFADHRVDILSNGFKLRVGAGSAINSSNAVIVYAAFAESPFGLNNRAR